MALLQGPFSALPGLQCRLQHACFANNRVGVKGTEPSGGAPLDLNTAKATSSGHRLLLGVLAGLARSESLHTGPHVFQATAHPLGSEKIKGGASKS